MEWHSLAMSWAFAGCHSSVTVLTANTTQIIKICTPRNLFPMIRASEICKKRLKHQTTGKFFSKWLFLPAGLKRRTKALQFDVRCKAFGRNFDCGCGFFQDTYNGATINMALPLQKPLRNFLLLWISFGLIDLYNVDQQDEGTSHRQQKALMIGGAPMMVRAKARTH